MSDTATAACPECNGGNVAKAGKRKDGLQWYRCGSCGKTFSGHKEHNNVFGHKQAVDDAKNAAGDSTSR